MGRFRHEKYLIHVWESMSFVGAEFFKGIEEKNQTNLVQSVEIQMERAFYLEILEM